MIGSSIQSDEGDCPSDCMYACIERSFIVLTHSLIANALLYSKCRPSTLYSTDNHTVKDWLITPVLIYLYIIVES